MKHTNKLIFTALFAAACGGMCMACSSSKELKGNNRDVTLTRNVGYFSQIQSLGHADIQFAQGATNSVRIVGPKSDADNIVLEKNGDALVIKYKGSGKWFNNDGDDVTVYITSTDITAVNLSGSGSFRATSDIDTDRFRVTIKGSGDVTLRNVVCDDATLETRGSGDIAATGIDTRSARVTCIGSGDIAIKSIKADNADFLVRGSGDISTVLRNATTTNMTIYGSGDIAAKMIGCGSATVATYGSGDITLSGSLGSLNQTSKGSGDINIDRLTLGK